MQNVKHGKTEAQRECAKCAPMPAQVDFALSMNSYTCCTYIYKYNGAELIGSVDYAVAHNFSSLIFNASPLFTQSTLHSYSDGKDVLN